MAVFRSKYSNLKVLMQPAELAVVNGIPVRTPGKYLEFENGQYETSDKKEVAFIRKLSAFGVTVFEDKEEPSSIAH